MRAIRARAADDDEISVFESSADRSEDPGQEAPPSPAPAKDADEGLGIPEDAWSLARCDARLTERLGLL
jgi:hypothetical protein